MLSQAVSFRVYPNHRILRYPKSTNEQTTVYIHAWILHRDPRLWHPDPEDFPPTRWLDATGARRTHHREREIYIPFSYGPYNYIGQRFALLEMCLATAVIVRNFDFVLAPSLDPDEFQKSATAEFFFIKGELPVIL